jgi:c-di-GMP-binding flagellar brake protein YcgR
MDQAQVQDQKPQEFSFESLNMQVGVRLQFLTHRGVKPVPYFSTLVGYVKDEYIIVKIPTEHGAPISLTDGERVTIRVFSGVNVCSFAGTVERVFARPLSYVHLSFPTEIAGTSLRGAMRVKTEIPARAISIARPDAAPADCRLVNISVTGARVDSPVPLPADGESIGLQFSILIPGTKQETRIDTRALVRNVTVEDGVHSHGVQFIDLDPVHYTLLQNLTYEALLADRMKIV